MKQVLLQVIRWYQRYLSIRDPLICRYSPTCSEYTYQAIARFGIIKGLRLGTGRILRCHPFAKGGFDPLPKY